MQYKRLAFQDYFTICSENYNKRTTDLDIAQYEHVYYTFKGKEYCVDFQVRYDEARHCIQVIFQQTDGKADWRVNFTFPSKLYDKFTFDGKLIQLRVHRGWGNMWLACQETVRQKLLGFIKDYPEAQIEVFGWSLGSALAQLCAQDIYFKFGIKPYLYTYGSVKPFFGKVTHKFVKTCCKQVYNFYDHCDIVGYVVPLFGWRAINHCKVKLEPFCIIKLFKPFTYHTQYDAPELYINYK